MNLLAITTNDGITWGDLLVFLAIAALIIFCLSFWRRR